MPDGSRRTATQKLRRMPEELTVGRRWLALRPALLLELHVVFFGFFKLCWCASTVLGACMLVLPPPQPPFDCWDP